MRDHLTSLRECYFKDIANQVSSCDAQFIVLTHLLPDRPEFFLALEEIAPISMIIAIPYSIHQPTCYALQNKYNILTPSLDNLRNKHYLLEILKKNIQSSKPVIIIEIGGYFASVICEANKILPSNLLGVIEDTEAGLLQYLKYEDQLPCPIISVARSSLKETEDFLVGASCLYSTEKLLRATGFPIGGKYSLVLGYGKVGRGVAYALHRHHCPVLVYDTDPIQRIKALSEGFKIPSKSQAFYQAEIIYGATGNNSIVGDDFTKIRNGALLVSCSSKDQEFDLNHLNSLYHKKAIIDGIDQYQNDDHMLYLAASGQPVNFIDGAVIGPMLALVQAEMIMAIKDLFSLQGRKGLFETNKETKSILAEKWMDYFCDSTTGRYKNV
ncbi:adenosylhomocysteinase [soil metagenome]